MHSAARSFTSSSSERPSHAPPSTDRSTPGLMLLDPAALGALSLPRSVAGSNRPRTRPAASKTPAEHARPPHSSRGAASSPGAAPGAPQETLAAAGTLPGTLPGRGVLGGLWRRRGSGLYHFLGCSGLLSYALRLSLTFPLLLTSHSSRMRTVLLVNSHQRQTKWNIVLGKTPLSSISN